MGMATMIITTVVLIALFVAALRAYLIRKKKRYLMSKYTDDHEVELIMKKHVWRGMSEEQLLEFAWASNCEVSGCSEISKSQRHLNTIGWGRTVSKCVFGSRTERSLDGPKIDLSCFQPIYWKTTSLANL